MNPKRLDTDFSNIPEAFFAVAAAHPNLPVFSQAVIGTVAGAPRAWQGRTFAEEAARVRSIAGFLAARGVSSGKGVAVLSNTRPEWLEADLGILTLGGVSVAIYPSLAGGDVAYQLFDSETEIVFAENEEQLEKLRSIQGRSQLFPATEDRPASEGTVRLRTVVVFEAVEKRSTEPFEIVPFLEVIQSTPCTERVEIAPTALASLVYTSGTTGPPKGVMQTHRNHLANVRQAAEAEMYEPDSIIMLFLPLAHSFARLMGYIGFLTTTQLRFTAISSRVSSKPDPVSWAEDIRNAGATLVPSVPRILEKMRDGVAAKLDSRTPIGVLLRLTRWSGRHRRESFVAALFYQITGPLRGSLRRKLFGNQFHAVVSGGAKLPPDVATFFDDFGIEILEGYGLTETAVATNVNRFGKKRIGTVGPVLAPDIEVRIAEDGEILFRGPNIARGYYKRPTATRAAWDEDGWFHTGDIGELSSDGFLSITGRKKELIVTAGGKKIVPDKIEPRLKAHSLISQAVLLGEGKPYCVALLTLNDLAVEAWSGRQGVKGNPTAQREAIEAELGRHLVKVNEALASFETVKRFAIIGEDFTIDNGLLTPTFKVRRREVEKRYSEEIAKLYADGRE